MGNNNITVLVRIKAKPGMEEEVKKELLSLVTLTRAEAGCLLYDLNQSAEDSSLFMFYENWVCKKDLDEHLAMPYLKSHMKKASEILAGPAEITLWERIG